MGIHEWSYSNNYDPRNREAVPHAKLEASLKNLKLEVELGFDDKVAAREVERCLNCDVQTVFTGALCIECDACMDICPVDCINFTENDDEPRADSRYQRLSRGAKRDVYRVHERHFCCRLRLDALLCDRV